MTTKKFRVMLLNGTVTDTLYDTPMDAMKAHRGDIKKLIEVAEKKKSGTGLVFTL